MGACLHCLASASAQPLIADPETEPHKYEMQILALYNLSSSSTSSTDDKILGKTTNCYVGSNLDTIKHAMALLVKWPHLGWYSSIHRYIAIHIEMCLELKEMDI